MKTIAFVHGWGMHSGVFADLCDALSREFAICAPDLPGHGGTRPCEPYTLEQLVSDVSRRAPERSLVVGWSLGGQIALSWAHTRPQQVERLALIAATPCFTRRDDWVAALDGSVLDAFRRAFAQDVHGGLQRFISLQAQGDDASKRVARTLRGTLSARPLPDVAALEEGLRLLHQTDLRDVLAQVRQPTLVIHGKRDELVPLAAGEYLVRRLPRSTLQPIAGAAHAPFVSKPEEVARRIAEHFG